VCQGCAFTGSVEIMLILDLFQFWQIWFIIAFVIAVIYGSLSGVLFTISAGLFVTGLQLPEYGFALKIASGILFLCAIHFFYRAYFHACLEKYKKDIEKEPVSPPINYEVVLLNKIKHWLKLG
jgi:hypothetical protein